jgi:hypothetical protein
MEPQMIDDKLFSIIFVFKSIMRVSLIVFIFIFAKVNKPSNGMLLYRLIAFHFEINFMLI